ncbi:MAG: V-type ATPase subunit [Lachnospiraceae bacterium]
MGNLLAYSGIVTKVRAMSAQLLTEKNYQELSELSTIPEIVSYLKHFPPYNETFQILSEDQLHRGNIEKVFIQSLYNDYTKLYRFSGIAHRKYLKLYMKRYEVDLINYCFRIILNHYEEPFDLNYKKPFFDKYSQISIDKLITSSSLDEFIENLNGTEYYAPLKKLREAGVSKLFDYNLALELYYFNAVWKEKKKILQKKELDIFTRDTGSKIDLLNLQWIYRSKKYYNMLPANIYALLIPIHFHLKKDTLKELVEAPTLDDFAASAERSYYGRKYNLEAPYSIEQLYKDCLHHLYLADQRKNPYSIASINAYLFLKEEEIKRLTTTMECVRYGFTPREILRYAGGVEKA